MMILNTLLDECREYVDWVAQGRATSLYSDMKLRRQLDDAIFRVSAFSKARFGVFERDGTFRELPDTGWERDPLAHTARWVGGEHDMQVIMAALTPNVQAHRAAEGGSAGAQDNMTDAERAERKRKLRRKAIAGWKKRKKAAE
jgi:hypothetical protein